MTVLAALVIVLWPVVLRRAAAARVRVRLQPHRPPVPKRSRWSRPAESRARDLAGALDRLAAALRSGAPLAVAFALSAEGTEGSLHDELTTVGVDLARDPDGALERWRARRCNDPSAALVAGALSLGHAIGGDRVRAVEIAAVTLREHAQLEAEVRVQAAQARVSAAVVAVTPVVFVFLAAATDRRTSSFLASAPGVLVATCALGLDALGAWWMVRLTKRVSRWA